MYKIRRYVPVRDFVGMADAMNRLFESNLARYDYTRNGGSARTVRHLPLDVYSTENAFVIVANLPGLKPENVDITVEGDELTIRAEFPAPQKDDENVHYILQERDYGSSERRLTFNVPVDADNIEATFEAGQLKLIVPKTEAIRPRQIKVQAR